MSTSKPNSLLLKPTSSWLGFGPCGLGVDFWHTSPYNARVLICSATWLIVCAPAWTRWGHVPLHYTWYLLTEIFMFNRRMSLKNIATSKRVRGVAPGKLWKSMNVQTFLTPLFESLKLFDPLFGASKLFPPPTKVFMNTPLQVHEIRASTTWWSINPCEPRPCINPELCVKCVNQLSEIAPSNV